MPMFSSQKSKLSLITEIPIKLEKDLQKLTEENLSTIFALDFISSEFSLQQFRIDTVAFDPETKAFVIIEYKKDRSISIVDQGYTYLALMLNNKADFILEYNEQMKRNLKREDVDWSQSKVMFIANSFTAYQQNAINFKDLPIELWEAKMFDNKTILYNQLKSSQATESIKTISKDKTIQNVSKEIVKYSVDDHFKGSRQAMRDLFDDLKERIFEIDSRIEENINKYYMAFKVQGLKWNICNVRIYTDKLHLKLMRVERKDLKDPDKRVEKINWEKFGWGRECLFVIRNQDDIDYALFLIKQVYKKFYN
jgi:predicted transport protein